jgi:hypothetical protein
VIDVVCSYCGARYETVVAPELLGVIRRCAYCHRRGLRVDGPMAARADAEGGGLADEDRPDSDER